MSSPPSHSSLETPSPLDLASGLTTRLQAASFQLPVTDCAVLPDSVALGAGIPSLFPSLAEEGLVSLSKRVFSRVVAVVEYYMYLLRL